MPDFPPQGVSGRERLAENEEMARQLREKPDTWMRYPVKVGHPQPLITKIRGGRKKAFQPKGHFDARVDTDGWVWVCYLPKAHRGKRRSMKFETKKKPA